MPSVEISPIIYDLLESSVERSDVYDDVDSTVEEVLKVFLAKRDLFERMYWPFSTILMNSVDDLVTVRKLLEGVDWQSRTDAVAEAIQHLEIAEGILREHAEELSNEGK
ncbi:MAG: hypothetical protein ACOC38_04165 [Promethearchaeia archaeon]